MLTISKPRSQIDSTQRFSHLHPLFSFSSDSVFSCISSLTATGVLQWTERQCTRKADALTVTATFELKPPPYPMDDLEPHMSKDTFEYHRGKHHRAYVDNLNMQIDGTERDDMSLDDVVLVTYNKGGPLPAFNNAAQAWNHEFFLESMKPGGGGKASGELLQLIERDFGSFDRFVQEFKSAAAAQFGSGWAWLVCSDLSLCQQLHFLLLILLNYNNLLACTSENKSNISCLLFSLDKENRLRCWKCCKSSSIGGG
uniref:Superoxide dismutase n=1 Tax=Populus davidiana TaxID=266767 RepID=A0A6M2EBG0_9ROSI